MKTIVLYIVVTILSLIAWTCAVFIGTTSGWLRQSIAKEKTHQSFSEAVDREMQKQFVGSFAMAMIENGTVVAEKFYTAGNPVDRNTVFQVSSLSKWISAFGVMKLVENGKIDLDAPVNRYLTRWQLPKGEFDNAEVTVRRLLSHTAGLTDGLGYSGFQTEGDIQSLEQSLTKASDADEGAHGSVSVGLKPGSEFKYSGGGYTLLQLLVEEVSHMSFASYMKDSILLPLGMKQSGYVWNDTSSLSLTTFYNPDGTKAKHSRYTSKAATSLYTSLSDLEIFFQAHLKGKENEPIGRNVLKPETLMMMRKGHGRKMGFDIWGLGTVLYTTTGNGDYIFGHDGKSTPPINTAVRLNPETGDGIIVLETGHPIIATRLASEWVFWKTGQIDTLLFPLLMDGMIVNIGIGWAVIVGCVVGFGYLTRRTR